MPTKVRISKDDLMRGKIVEPGWYAVEVHGVTEKAAKTDGSQNWIVEYKVLNDGEFQGVLVNRLFNEKAAGMMAPFLIACGQKIGAEGGEFDIYATIGRKIQIHVTNDTTNKGRTINSVEDYRPLK